MTRILIILIGWLLVAGCDAKRKTEADTELPLFTSIPKLSELNLKLSDVIISDIFTPPVASRIYAYANIAAYEANRFENEESTSLSVKLNGLSTPPLPNEQAKYDFQMAGAVAFMTTARSLVYDASAIEQIETNYLSLAAKTDIGEGIYNRSIEFGRSIGEHILDWANADGYNQRTSNMAYIVNSEAGRWQPTPPDYAEAIEPHWNTLRPFLLDSANQFNPGSPTSFDIAQESAFYQGAVEVYQVVRSINEEQLAIAKFWDCNPNISHTNGHVMYYDQQISPGGHWIHIACQVIEAEDLVEAKSAEVLAKLSLTLADAFISCWDEKYRSSLIRPETYINRYIDEDWQPILQTPAFPEHTSGHSVASSSAATILTHFFGEAYHLQDSTEVPFGLPIRAFDSFFEASNEAAISRLYGGIHYMPAIEKGVDQGKKLGRFVINKLIESEN
ncbi:MAG: vanadium-dependent haloperoxidase [Reichenbachiella sp.]|uniref:vanadium-dependent haloperoxidase n=1 Tax=Reichenbachiella sp. TaxID=2184521 RepID=UPI00329A3F4B